RVLSTRVDGAVRQRLSRYGEPERHWMPGLPRALLPGVSVTRTPHSLSCAGIRTCSAQATAGSLRFGSFQVRQLRLSLGGVPAIVGHASPVLRTRRAGARRSMALSNT